LPPSDAGAHRWGGLQGLIEAMAWRQDESQPAPSIHHLTYSARLPSAIHGIIVLIVARQPRCGRRMSKLFGALGGQNGGPRLATRSRYGELDIRSGPHCLAGGEDRCRTLLTNPGWPAGGVGKIATFGSLDSWSRADHSLTLQSSPLLLLSFVCLLLGLLVPVWVR